METIEVDWNKLRNIELILDDPKDHEKLPYIKIVVFPPEKIPSVWTMESSIDECIDEDISIQSSASALLFGTTTVNTLIPKKVFQSSLIEAINDQKEIIRVDSIIEHLKQARQQLVQALWRKGIPAFIYDAEHQFANSNGYITSKNKTYGTFKMMRLYFDNFEDGYVDAQLLYANIARLPDTIDTVEYVIKGSNVTVVLEDVTLIENKEDGKFKILNVRTPVNNAEIIKLSDESVITYPGTSQEMTSTPIITHGDKGISRRLSSIINVKHKEVAIENTVQTIRKRFEKLT